VEVLGETGFYETCNIAYRREILERVGGFDEQFGYYAEDTDLAWRAKESGARAVFVPDAVVVHEVRPSDFRAYLRVSTRREGIVRAIARHPQIRRSYPAGVFASRAHAAALGLVGSTALASARRSPVTVGVATLCLAQYIRTARRERHEPRRRRQWATALPMALAADLYEIAVLTKASVRYRTLFL
jgi:GT2 family glycosyltransferase